MKALEENMCMFCGHSKDAYLQHTLCVDGRRDKRGEPDFPGPDCPYRIIKSQAAEIEKLTAQVNELVEYVIKKFENITNDNRLTIPRATIRCIVEDLLKQIQGEG